MVVMELTEKEICNQAIMVQDACNISGVLNSYYEIVCNLRKIKGYEPINWNRHPAVLLFQDKVDDMLYRPMEERKYMFDHYTDVLNACKLIAYGD
jgi:hypothetical protein